MKPKGHVAVKQTTKSRTDRYTTMSETAGRDEHPVTPPTPDQAPSPEALKAELTRIFKENGGDLRAILDALEASGGPLEGYDVNVWGMCTDEAGEMTIRSLPDLRAALIEAILSLHGPRAQGV